MLIAAPLKFVNGTGSPVRALAARPLTWSRAERRGTTEELRSRERGMSECDYVIVGGGINGWSPPRMLGKKGRKVARARAQRPRSAAACAREEITAPGFVHDVMATTLVLFRTSPAYQAHRQGPRSARLRRRRQRPADRRASAGRIERHVLAGSRAQREDVRRARRRRRRAPSPPKWRRWARTRRSCSPCSAARSGRARIAKTLAREAWRRGPRALAAWFGEALAPSRGYLETTYRSDAVHALWAPWVLHTGLGPESAYSAAMVKVIAFAVEAAGCPIAVGGAQDAARRVRAPDRRSRRRGCGRAPTLCASSSAPAAARAASSLQAGKRSRRPRA